MLNTPISVNKGTIVFYPLNNTITKNELFLLNLIGKTYKLSNEKFFNLITAIVGSGPAFFYFLLESMEKAAINHGLNKSFSRKILKETFIGTSEILNNSECNFKDLRKVVTSKGGTTEAAIKSLIKNNFEKIISNSIKDSIKKSKNLSSKK